MCPAIILATNRIDKVKGRIILLKDSIITIKNIKIKGVPKGTKWINICSVLLNHPNIINPIHMDKEKNIENIKWLVEVKI